MYTLQNKQMAKVNVRKTNTIFENEGNNIKTYVTLFDDSKGLGILLNHLIKDPFLSYRIFYFINF